MDAASLHDQMAQLAQDVLDTLAAAGGLTPCRVLLQPYTAIADDGCCEEGTACGGQLAVALDQLYRSDAFPAPNTLALPPACGCGGEAVAVMRARLSRCTSTPDDQGNAPAPGDLSAEAAVALIDAVALLDAVCVFAARYDYAMPAGVLPAGPEGGCGAYEVSVFVSPDDYTPPS